MAVLSKLNDVNVSEEYKKYIDNYSNMIETKENFVDVVRSMPGMFLGHRGNKGFLTMIREIFQNAVDQLILVTSPCNHILIIYNESTHEVTVIDNGLGIPFADMVRVYTEEYTSKNYTKRTGEYSSGLHGVGGKCVNAASTSFTVTSYKYDGTAMRLDLKEGFPVGVPYPVENPNKIQGTSVTFIPSTEVMGDLTLPWHDVYRLVKRIMSLTPIGSVLDFEAIGVDGKIHKEHIENKDGIITDLISRIKSPLIKPITMFHDDGTRKLELAICYDNPENGADVESVIAFSNFCPTSSGTHIDGVIDGICRWFVAYMNNIYLINQKSKEKIKVNATDIKCGLNVIISAAHLFPVFTGQAKESLDNEDFLAFGKEVVMRGLDDWSKSNPQDLSKLSQFFKDIAELRMKSEAGKVKIATKYQASSLTGLPAKYAKPLGKDHLELIIVEGDSAGGQAKNARNKQTQGIFPIRGKMPNAFQKSYKEFMENAEVQGIIRILLGRDYFRKFDPYKDCKYEKIIFMADADVDGAHIAALLLRFFVLYMPQLIEAGKVYKAIPPLYSIPFKKKDRTYFTEQIDITRYIQKIFTKNNMICDINGNQINSKDLTVLFMTNEDYVYELERVASNYSVTPMLLEMCLMNYFNKNSTSVLKKQIKSAYRFMDVTTKNGVQIVSGTIDKSYKLYMTDRLIKECESIFRIIKKNITCSYLLNGKEASLYEIMKAYELCQPTEIQRYKGLGEMDADELFISTMSSDSRTLLRYTLEDAKEEIAAIRDYESDLSQLLELVGDVKRTDLLD